MKILGHELSNNTNLIVNKLLSSFSKSVNFLPIHHLYSSKKNLSYFGAADYSKSDAYYIYLDESLYGEPFETNLLHELFHICQVEENYPTTSTKNNNITLPDLPFFNDLGSKISSSILDLDVEIRLNQNGYNSKYFINHRYKRIKILVKQFNISDKYDYASIQSQLVLFALMADETKLNLIKSILKTENIDLLNDLNLICDELSKLISSENYSALKSINYLITKFDLWDILLINFNNQVLKSEDECLRILNSNIPWK